MAALRSRSRPATSSARAFPVRREPWPVTVFLRHPQAFAPTLRARIALGRREVAGVRRILGRAGIDPPARVVDISCGLGRHVVPLARAGYRVVGCDFSPAFLREARRRARALGLRPPTVRFYRTDYARLARTMREAGEPPFDAAVCLFTSLGYRGRQADVRVLRGLLRNVRPGGLFVWETGDRDWVLRHFEPEGVTTADRSHEVRERRRYLPARGAVRCEWTFRVRDRRGRWRRVLEVVVRIHLHSEHEIRGLLRESGWSLRRFYGDLSTLAPRTRSSRRLVVVAQRPYVPGPGARARSRALRK